MVNKLDLSGRLARWILMLEEFDYTVEYNVGRIYLQADNLSRISNRLGVTPIDDRLKEQMLFVVATTEVLCCMP